MVKEFNHTEASDDSRSLIQLELLEALLASNDSTYPWNPTDPESEAYFVEQEQQFPLEDWSESEITARSDSFFSQIEQTWNEILPEVEYISVSNVTDSQYLQANLQQRFAAYIPQGWLQAIADRASQVLTNQKSMTDKLVQCVQELLPNWAEDDLLILARPFASSMRSADTTTVESVLGNASCSQWAALSEIEQARASLAIARYALAQLQK
jgi:hypothetical protein